jgi:ferredoxin-like protein FixX
MFKKIFPLKGQIVPEREGASSYFADEAGEEEININNALGAPTPASELSPLEQLLNFISDNVVELHKNKSKERLEALTILTASLNITPDNDPALFVLLGGHGWNGEVFDSSYISNSSFVALKQSLSTLYFNSLAISTASYADEQNNALKTDEGLMFSFCPNILFSHVATGVYFTSNLCVMCTTCVYFTSNLCVM